MYEQLHLCCRNARNFPVCFLVRRGCYIELTYFRREINLNTDALTPYFLLEPGEDKGICPDFLEEAVARFAEDDMAKSMIVKAFMAMSSKLSNMTMNDVYKPYVHVRYVEFWYQQLELILF